MAAARKSRPAAKSPPRKRPAETPVLVRPEPVKPVHQPVKTGETVTVACKCPNGLILRVFKMVENWVPVFGGGTRNEPIAQAMGEALTIAGPGREIGQDPRWPVANGFALTFGVPKVFWDLWLSQNRNTQVVLNGLIFARPSADGVSKESKNRAQIRTGLEPLMQDGDLRLPRDEHHARPIKAVIE